MNNLLLALVVVLAVVAIAQIARIYHLAATLRNQREENISQADNKLNATLMLAFMIALFAFFIWQLIAFKDVVLPVPASEHGVRVENLLTVNWIIIFAVFFLVNFLLFYFSWKYQRDLSRKAAYRAHNNKLEFIWTIIPSMVLAFLIIYGLNVWNDIMDDPSEDAISIELYAKQFDWTARYSGNDGELGPANFTLISNTNPLGLITRGSIDEKVKEIDTEVSGLRAQLDTAILPDSRVEEIEDKIALLGRQRARVMNYSSGQVADLNIANDDRIVKGEFHIPVGREVSFTFRSRDVIHSAYMPHFRAQMNCVPGMTTTFKFTPTITTDSMRTLLDDEQFNYVLLCNKVCGTSHYNMQMNIIVESEEDYQAWLAEQKAFTAAEPTAALNSEVEQVAVTNE